MFFADIPGLEEVKKLLIGSVERQHVAHAQLFLGREGSGALALALAYSAFINCTNRSATDSCGECPGCTKIHKHIHPDVHYLMPVTTTKSVAKDPVSTKFLPEWRTFLASQPYGTLNDWTHHIGAENKQALIGREESRLLIRTLSLKAFEADLKVMLIWLPELMNPQTANALLKILEEPPGQTIFLLVSNDAEKLLPTIRSRCQLLQVRPFTENETINYLVEKLQVSPDTAPQIAQLAEGNLQAAKILASEVNNDYFTFFRDWMRTAYQGDLLKVMAMSDEFQKMGRENQKNFLQFGLALLRKCILAGIDPVLAQGSSAEEQDFISKFRNLLHENNRDEITRILTEAHYHVERNANPKIMFTDISLKTGALLRQKQEVAS